MRLQPKPDVTQSPRRPLLPRHRTGRIQQPKQSDTTSIGDQPLGQLICNHPASAEASHVADAIGAGGFQDGQIDIGHLFDADARLPEAVGVRRLQCVHRYLIDVLSSSV
jgi:hypothetical protein